MYFIENDIPDLIYTNSKKNDVAVIKDYKLDIAYGEDENSFELSVPRNTVHIESDSFVYLEETEYGGIVDRFEIDTEENVFVYSGRSWHGILEKKIVIPEEGNDYYIIDESDANLAIADVLRHVGLTDYTMQDVEGYTTYIYKYEDEEGNKFHFLPKLDEVSGAEGVEVPIYYQARYGNVYEVMNDMLNKAGMKLKIAYPANINGKRYNACQIYAEPIRDYANDDEWQLHNTDFIAKKVDKKVNHLICLGQGELKDRYVINLYADENGGIVKWYKEDAYMTRGGWVNTAWSKSTSLEEKHEVLYNSEQDAYYGYYLVNGEYKYICKTTSELRDLGYKYYSNEKGTEDLVDGNIVRDSDYILDSAYYSGLDDVVEVLDIPNADFTENYLLMKYMPLDFSKNFSNYYSYDGKSFKQLEYIKKYVLQNYPPNDWSINFEKYFYKDGEEYRGVNGVNGEDTHVLQTKKPNDWSTNYSAYTYKTTDGTVDTYKSIPNKEVKDYVEQTVKPSDWEENYKAYFVRATVYVQNKSKKFVKNTIYKLEEQRYILLKKKPEGWNKNYNTYFVKTTKRIPIPEGENDKAPTWKSKKYFTYKTIKVKNPDFEEYSKLYGVYLNKPNVSAPEWKENTYYSYNDIVPNFEMNKFYELSVDHYAELVKEGIKKLLEYQNQDTIKINLPQGYEYDVGDLVGTYDDETGLSIIQPITKKIVKIDGRKQVISYKIGGN